MNTSHQTITTTTTTSSHQTVIVGTPNHTSFSYRKKHRQQSHAISAGYLLLIGAGILYGLPAYSDVFSLSFILHNAFLLHPVNDAKVFQTMFFVGGLIGSLAATFLLHKLRKAIHYYLSGALMLLCGIIFLAAYDNGDALTAANFFGGLSFGIVFLTTLIHASEICVKYLRGGNVFSVQNGLDCGLLLFFVIRQVTVMNTEKPALNAPQSIGVALIVISLLSFLLTFALCIESSEFLYEAGNDSEARSNMMKLRNESVETLEIVRDLDEIQNSVRMARIEGIANIFNKDDIKPFLRTFILRFAYVMATGVPVNIILLMLNQLFYQYTFAGTLFILCRLFGSLVGLALVDRIGRKMLLIVSLGAGGLLLIVINAVFMGARKNLSFDSSTIDLLGILSLIYQIIVGVGSGGCSSVIMGEVFPYISRSYLNGLLIAMECLIYIITINSLKVLNNADGYDAFIFIAAAAQIIACAFTLFFIPETKHKSLKEANELYKKKII